MKIMSKYNIMAKCVNIIFSDTDIFDLNIY